MFNACKSDMNLNDVSFEKFVCSSVASWTFKLFTYEGKVVLIATMKDKKGNESFPFDLNSQSYDSQKMQIYEKCFYEMIN